METTIDDFEQLPLIDSDIRFYRQIDLGSPCHDLLNELIRTTPWRQQEITIYGKSWPQPRLSAWYGDREATYRYSGISMDPLPWTNTLLDIKTAIETLTGQRFNSVLLNYYRDNQDSMGMHSDDERELGPEPVIASLSLGEERTFLLKHKSRKDLRTLKLPLPSGSLLLMKGLTQRHWKHGINKERTRCGTRVNLTFRTIFLR